MSDLDPKDYYKHTNVFKVTALDTHLERSAAKDMEAEDKPLSSLKAYDPNDPERKKKRIRDERLDNNKKKFDYEIVDMDIKILSD